MSTYIHQRHQWPAFRWDDRSILLPLAETRNRQGRVMGKMEALGFELRSEAVLDTLTMDVLKSSEIEGELLDTAQVRSSLARRLGMEIAGLVESDRNVDGVVDMMLDATQHYKRPLTAERLFGWHAALFPTGYSGLYKIKTGGWRDGPMQVVSGAMGKERVHFRAPEAKLVDKEMKRFIRWFNQEEKLDPVLKAALAHVWFLTVHPFDDGNGRIARALTDMLLARADRSAQRFYSMSARIRVARKGYYEILERTQRGDLDVTEWLLWFFECLSGALGSTEKLLANVLYKADFWNAFALMDFNSRQKLMLNKLLDGFEGKLTSSKWAKIAKCSADTALRDIQDLVSRNILRKEEAGGRSTSYGLR